MIKNSRNNMNKRSKLYKRINRTEPRTEEQIREDLWIIKREFTRTLDNVKKFTELTEYIKSLNPCESFEQNLRTFFYGEQEKYCSCGKIKPFVSYSGGYRKFCTTTLSECPALQNKSTKISKSLTKTYQDHRETILAERKQTYLKNYGHDHHLKSTSFKEDLKKKNLETIGAEWSIQTTKHQETIISAYKRINGTTSPFKPLAHRLFCELPKSQAKSEIEELLKEMTSLELMDYLEIGRDTFYKKLKSLNVQMSGSLEQQNLVQEIKKITDLTIIENSRSLIKPLEIDIYIPKINLAIEYNGTYWHSKDKKDKFYHQNKTLSLWEKRIDLVHVFSDDYHKNQREILEHLKNLISYKTSGDVKFLSSFMFMTKVPLDLGLLEFYHQLKRSYVITDPTESGNCFNSGFIEII